MVYCVATIQEIQRVSCVAPSTLIHCPTHDVELKGYKIPKDTMIAANLAKFMMDPEVFSEPKKLLPDRFIEHEGNKSKLKVNSYSNGIRKLFYFNILYDILKSILFVNHFHVVENQTIRSIRIWEPSVPW